MLFCMFPIVKNNATISSHLLQHCRMVIGSGRCRSATLEEVLSNTSGFQMKSVVVYLSFHHVMSLCSVCVVCDYWRVFLSFETLS